MKLKALMALTASTLAVVLLGPLTAKGAGPAFITNTGSSTISSDNIGFDGALRLLESIASMATGAVIDAALSLDGRYLYALSGSTANIDAFEVGVDGGLSPLIGISGLPIGSNGLAAH
jgi:hypothetical protein